MSHTLSLIINMLYIVALGTRRLTWQLCTCRYVSYVRSVCQSVCRLSVTIVHPTQAVEIFDNISTAFGTLAIR